MKWFFREVEEVKKPKIVDDEQPEEETEDSVKNGDGKSEENGAEKDTEPEPKTEGENNAYWLYLIL